MPRKSIGEPLTPPNPSGLCQCGCGQPTAIARMTSRACGHIAGEHVRFLPGHNARQGGHQPIRCECERCGREFFIQPNYQRRGGGRYCSDACRSARQIVPHPEIDGALLVELTQGKWAVIDEADRSLVAPYCWHAQRVAQLAGDQWYAVRREGGRLISMHAIIAATPAGLVTDHADGDGLNNRRENLRVATISQNVANRRMTTNRHGFRGVRHSGQTWYAIIIVRGEHRLVAKCQSAEEAALAYDQAAREAFGPFARLNFPNPGERRAHSSPPRRSTQV